MRKLTFSYWRSVGILTSLIISSVLTSVQNNLEYRQAANEMLDKLADLYEAIGEKPLLLLLSWLMLASGPITLITMLLGLRASYGRYSSESLLKNVSSTRTGKTASSHTVCSSRSDRVASPRSAFAADTARRPLLLLEAHRACQPRRHTSLYGALFSKVIRPVSS